MKVKKKIELLNTALNNYTLYLFIKYILFSPNLNTTFSYKIIINLMIFLLSFQFVSYRKVHSNGVNLGFNFNEDEFYGEMPNS